jgi:sulfite exporter TauE/SafE
MTWSRFSSFVLWALVVIVILQLFYQLLGQKIKFLVPKLMSSKWLPMGLGLITGLLPCGLLIPAYIGASSMPGKSMVFLSMFFFFAGTLPAMLMSKSLLEILKKRLPSSLQSWVNPSLAAIFLLAQIWMMTR